MKVLLLEKERVRGLERVWELVLVQGLKLVMEH